MTDWLREHFTASDAGVRPHWRRSTTSRVNLSNNEMCHPAVARLLTEAVAGLRPEDWISYPDYAVARDRFAGLSECRPPVCCSPPVPTRRTGRCCTPSPRRAGYC
ncbi:hypothetical protein [Streptomyces sp. NPDC006971]|uniref:hypothetical protein n=1 Tax=Streptomyces sp. NPDC006971 TaxID=3154784 RepID=UPI0033FFC85E